MKSEPAFARATVGTKSLPKDGFIESGFLDGGGAVGSAESARRFREPIGMEDVVFWNSTADTNRTNKTDKSIR